MVICNFWGPGRRGVATSEDGVGLVGEENRALAQVLVRAREGGFDARRTDRCAQPRSADATPAGRGARGAAEADS